MDEKPRGSGLPPPSASSRRNASRKRAIGAGGNPGLSSSQAPKKKKKKTRRRKKPLKAPRGAAPHYLVQETDNDMLLIISNVGETPEWPRPKLPKKKKTTLKATKQQKRVKKRAANKGKDVEGEASAGRQTAPGVLGEEESKALPHAPQSAAWGSWGSHLPVEILVQIFQLGVASEGSVPFLCRMARVCRLWNGAASNPVLWKKVSVGYCWATPGKKCPPVLEKKVLGTVKWLVESRFSHLQDFALCHWKSHVPFVLKEISHSCPLLASLKLSHCSGITTESLCALAGCCPQLRSLNLQNSQVDSSAVLRFLEAAGSRIQHMWLTYSSRMSAIIAVLVCLVNLEFPSQKTPEQILQSWNKRRGPLMDQCDVTHISVPLGICGLMYTYSPFTTEEG